MAKLIEIVCYLCGHGIVLKELMGSLTIQRNYKEEILLVILMSKHFLALLQNRSIMQIVSMLLIERFFEVTSINRLHRFVHYLLTRIFIH